MLLIARTVGFEHIENAPYLLFGGRHSAHMNKERKGCRIEFQDYEPIVDPIESRTGYLLSGVRTEMIEQKSLV